jgi:hypothetical protein
MSAEDKSAVLDATYQMVFTGGTAVTLHRSDADLAFVIVP